MLRTDERLLSAFADPKAAVPLSTHSGHPGPLSEFAQADLKANLGLAPPGTEIVCFTVGRTENALSGIALAKAK